MPSFIASGWCWPLFLTLGWPHVLAQERVPRGAAADLLRAVAQAERFEAALLECRKSLQVCEASPGEGAEKPSTPMRSSLLAPGALEAPEWPENYGDLLRFPFGIADMKTLKEVARELWSPSGSAADLLDEVSDRGFRQHKGMRCTSEMVGVHPIGGVGTRWSAQLWADAQDWCMANAGCTGIMLYVGSNTMHCNFWCAKSGDGTTQNVGIKVGASFQCAECRQKFDSEKVGNAAGSDEASDVAMPQAGDVPLVLAFSALNAVRSSILRRPSSCTGSSSTTQTDTKRIEQLPGKASFSTLWATSGQTSGQKCLLQTNLQVGASFQCVECRQKFDSEKARQLHWKSTAVLQRQRAAGHNGWRRRKWRLESLGQRADGVTFRLAAPIRGPKKRPADPRAS
eukprot:s162_g7.t3